MMDRPLKFDPNSDDHLIYALKLGYKHAAGDTDAGTQETMNALCDALCNLIGDDAYCAFIDEETE